MAACVVLMALNTNLRDWDYYHYGNSVSTGFKHEVVGVLLASAFCILVSSLLLLCWWSFLPVRKPVCVDKFLNAGAVIGLFSGGKD